MKGLFYLKNLDSTHDCSGRELVARERTAVHVKIEERADDEERDGLNRRSLAQEFE